jgi:hypothetical protein
MDSRKRPGLSHIFGDSFSVKPIVRAILTAIASTFTRRASRGLSGDRPYGKLF